MRAWSEYFQVPDFLEYTRSTMLTDEIRELLLTYMMVRDGDRVLEIGCGTGYLSRYVMGGRKRLNVTGIDSDSGFIRAAAAIFEKEFRENSPRGDSLKNQASFQVADARFLPFRDASFDRVISHTFLTSTPDSQAAMAEMVRVVRPGGSISSITAMSVSPAVICAGRYPASCRWLERYRELFIKVQNLYAAMDPIDGYINARDSSEIPALFVDNGLKEITLFPIGTAFSFSNAAFQAADREQYARRNYQAELLKLQHFLRLDGRWDYLSDEEAKEYERLLAVRRDYLMEHLDENSVFEWNGSAEILVTGRKGEDSTNGSIPCKI